MADRFAVDTERLALASQHLRDLSARLEGVVAKLRSGVDAQGECWGADPLGKSFAEQYVKPASAVRDGTTTLGKVLRDVEDGIGTMAKGFTRVEESTVDQINQFAGSVVEGGVPGGGRRS